MNWLDFAILAVLAWFTASAFSSGLVREGIALIAFLAGLILAGAVYLRLAEDLHLFIANEQLAKALAFLAIFGGTVLAGQITATLLKHVASLLMLEPFDRLAGGLFGLLKGILLVEAVLIVFTTYPTLGMQTAIAGSFLAPFFLEAIPLVLYILPGEFRRAVQG